MFPLLYVHFVKRSCAIIISFRSPYYYRFLCKMNASLKKYDIDF